MIKTNEVGIPYSFIKEYTTLKQIDMSEPLQINVVDSHDIQDKLFDESKYASVVLSNETFELFRNNNYVQYFYLKLFRDLIGRHYLTIYAVYDSDEVIVIAVHEDPVLTDTPF